MAAPAESERSEIIERIGAERARFARRYKNTLEAGTDTDPAKSNYYASICGDALDLITECFRLACLGNGKFKSGSVRTCTSDPDCAALAEATHSIPADSIEKLFGVENLSYSVARMSIQVFARLGREDFHPILVGWSFRAAGDPNGVWRSPPAVSLADFLAMLSEKLDVPDCSPADPTTKAARA